MDISIKQIYIDINFLQIFFSYRCSLYMHFESQLYFLNSLITYYHRKLIQVDVHELPGQFGHGIQGLDPFPGPDLYNREVRKARAVEPAYIVVGDDRRLPGGQHRRQVLHILANKDSGCLPLGLNNGFVHGKPMEFV